MRKIVLSLALSCLAAAAGCDASLDRDRPRDAGTTALDARDPYTAGHSERVSAISVALGREIALRLARSPRFVDEWAARYRRGGIDALVPKRQPGRPPKLTPEQAQQLKARLDAGPRDTDACSPGVWSPRGRAGHSRARTAASPTTPPIRRRKPLWRS